MFYHSDKTSNKEYLNGVQECENDIRSCFHRNMAVINIILYLESKVKLAEDNFTNYNSGFHEGYYDALKFYISELRGDL